MGMALLSAETERVEYTEFGNYSYQLMIPRGMRNLEELARRIKARGYEKRLSGQTVGNYFKGLHQIPWEFLQYEVGVLNDAMPLTAEEVKRLGDLYAWRQKHPGTGGMDVENFKKAQNFINEVESEKSAPGRARRGPDDKTV